MRAVWGDRCCRATDSAGLEAAEHARLAETTDRDHRGGNNCAARRSVPVRRHFTGKFVGIDITPPVARIAPDQRTREQRTEPAFGASPGRSVALVSDRIVDHDIGSGCRDLLPRWEIAFSVQMARHWADADGRHWADSAGRRQVSLDHVSRSIDASTAGLACRVQLVALVIGFSDGALMIADDEAYKETPEMLGEILDGNQVEKSVLASRTNLWAAVGQFAGDHRTDHTATR